ncbi:hypothetical protein CQ011_01465 [Arthrobacter sp. MYb213]|nr:hypothetical protein CQ011_01465 [Arthrobacter sp. MYb213]
MRYRLELSPRDRPYDNHMEYSIGEFATLMNVTVKALHHYEKIELLKPVRVDRLTGYRKYSSAQFGTVMLIRQYRALGLTLAGIKRVIVDDVDDDTYEAILRNSQRVLASRIFKDLETYRALAAQLEEPDELSKFAEMHKQITSVSYDLAPPPSLMNGMLLPPPGIESFASEHGPARNLLSISTPLASRSSANLKQATQRLEKRLLSEALSEELMQQVWYWVETTEDPDEAPFLMHAGLEESENLPAIPGSVKNNFGNIEIGFAVPEFSAFGTSDWTQMVQHVHHEMYEQGALPSGPFFVRHGQNERYGGDFIAYQGGVIDESILRIEDDEDDLEKTTNPFAHWHSHL